MIATDAGSAPSLQDQQPVTFEAATEVQQQNGNHQLRVDNAEVSIARVWNDPAFLHNSEALQRQGSSPGLDTLSRKRKRASSPPWLFPTAQQTTIKTSDGRRSSARVNASVSNTPGLSESESQGPRTSRAASSRLSSPPWKEFKAEGPATVNVDGVRKSGRVNKDLTQPKRISPRSKKQTDKLADDSPSASRTGSDGRVAAASKPAPIDITRKRSYSKTNGQARIQELSSRIAELQSVQDGKDKKHRRKDKEEHGTEVAGGRESADTIRKSSHGGIDKPGTSALRIKLRFNSARHTILPPHPHAAFPGQVHPPHLSPWQAIEDLELKEMQQPYSENERGPPSREEFDRRHKERAEQEAVMRQKLLDAAKPGGALSAERCSIFQDAGPQLEPPRQYGHVDHLVSHVMVLRYLQLKEDTYHRQLAKKLAHDAVEVWKKRHGPTEEDIRADEDKLFRATYKQLVIDIKSKWDLVRLHVDDGRRAIWEAEQEARRQERLQKQLAWSENMVAKQRGEVDSMASDNEDFDTADDHHDDDDDDESSIEDSDENMSDESSANESADREQDVMDDDALKAYLEQRAAEPPDKNISLADLLDGSPVSDTDDDETMQDASIQDEPSTQVVVDQPAELEHELSEDESIDMDSEEYDSDEDMSESDGEASDSEQSASSENTATRSGLLGFFSKSDLRAQGLPTPVTSAEGDHVNERDVGELGLDVRSAGEHNESDTAGGLQTGDKQDEPAERTLKTHLSALQAPSRPDTPTSQARSEQSIKNLVPQPALLHGQLRSYQHAGLDWLASLYRNGTNGILADEMGLGKTIQTISLFAHIAEQHNVWDPHLVIVPTSVILNWVTEFQKFLPGFRVLGYYGSTEERQSKRRGWVNDPHHELRDKRGYNVIVTSYNIALKDINAIRNVQWHYMVLDEAHNIRNFNSQRFQNLIKLKTRARILLTGTPLQNSLTELWSLLTFLTAGRDDHEAAHGGLEEFLARWKEPVNEIFERGVQTLSEEASKVVGQLHTSLRPFMLRRLKADVEKDLPKKTEHVVVCKLSKRQRQLYQDYMGLSDTRAKLTQGNAISAGKVLLSLRRVCNHPDLFDPRPIQTSYAMEHSPLEPYTARERAVRRLLGEPLPVPGKLSITALESERKYRKLRGKQLSAVNVMRRQVELFEGSINEAVTDTSTIAGCQAMLRVQKRRHHLEQVKDAIAYTEDYFSTRPMYGSDLREMLTVRATRTSFGCEVLGRMQITTLDSTLTPNMLVKHEARFDRLIARSTLIQHSIQSTDQRAESLHDSTVRFAFCTPEVTSPILDFAISNRVQKAIRASDWYPELYDSTHEARIRTSIVFPDSRLLVYDAGKLQRLTVLLRELQAKGSRSLIFTQMSGSLNILEQFLSLMNLPYLRLDGSTPVERRALYSAEFNRPDSKYQCMILSSRAGGVGLNLTGASSVIFYDLDWNPQMDKQCMDRAHRIGQVRDVEVYKMVSEKTVEENILRRANQKSLLDQTVIQEGHFTTDYNRSQDDKAQPDDDVAAAIDRFLSGGDKAVTKTIESIEDKEDVQAAQQARKEEMQDEDDFAEKPARTTSAQPDVELSTAVGRGDLDGHIDSYMIRYLEEALRYVQYVPPVVVTRDPSHRKKRRR